MTAVVAVQRTAHKVSGSGLVDPVGQDLLIHLGIPVVKIRLVSEVGVGFAFWRICLQIFEIDLERVILDRPAEWIATGVDIDPAMHHGWPAAGIVVLLKALLNRQ